MKLKVKLLKWSAGLPVVMLRDKTAEELGVHAKDRISIKANSKSLSTIVDIMGRLVKKDELAISAEIKDRLNLKKGQKVEISLADTPKSLVYIKEKLNKKILTKDKINEIIKDIVSNSLSEAEIALFVSAMYKNGMNTSETVDLIKAILKNGETIKFKNKFVVDKHSIGGIPGNRTTPIVVAICASAGLTMPKTSSRAITSAAGTADTIETIAKVDFSMKELKKIVKKTNACLVWGGGLGMVPADSKIIKVEKMLKIDPEAQLLASIMSKKLAVGSKYILIDIPYGKTAKVTLPKAKKLKKKFEQLGKIFKLKLKVVLTRGNAPIGRGIGPALEMQDVIAVLDPKQKGPKDLEEKSLMLAEELFKMTGKTKDKKHSSMAKEILRSGKAFEKFKEIIKEQNGVIKKIPLAKFKKDIHARKSGKIKEINNKKINSLARVAGCPVDKMAGLQIFVVPGSRVKKGEKILTIFSESKTRLNQAAKYYSNEKPIR